eukprot:3008290-Rhodomonas_salina.1
MARWGRGGHEGRWGGKGTPLCALVPPPPIFSIIPLCTLRILTYKSIQQDSVQKLLSGCKA